MSVQDAALVKTFDRLLAAGLAVLGVFLATGAVAGSSVDKTELDERMRARIVENVRPVGQLNVGAAPSADAAAPAAAAAPRAGKDIFNGTCMACHGTGVAGAPKVGDKAAWSPRAEKGIDGLLKSAISGLNAMPPRGTCADCSDDELKGAIEYMLKESGL